MSDISPFRGHDFYFLGDDGALYRIKNKEMDKYKWEPSADDPEKSAHDYFMNLAEEDGALLSLRRDTTKMETKVANALKTDGDAVVLCLLLNFRSIKHPDKTETPPAVPEK